MAGWLSFIGFLEVLGQGGGLGGGWRSEAQGSELGSSVIGWLNRVLGCGA